MILNPFCKMPSSIACFVAVSCSVALAENAPSGKGSGADFAGTKAGQVRADNGLKMKLVWCPAGQFMMGSPKSEIGGWGMHDDAENQVRVMLTKGFWLGQTEVTQLQWQRLMRTTPWSNKRYKVRDPEALGLDGLTEGDDYPAQYLTWDQTMRFCGKLTFDEHRAGRLPSGCKYTLPTEAQWEYACRAGTTTAFSFGNNETDLGDSAWYGAVDGFGKPLRKELYAQKVGLKKPNRWGLFDMHGNVWERCRDFYAEKLPGGSDPEVKVGEGRVHRGGHWGNGAEHCRSATRSHADPDWATSGIGFRVVLEQSGK